MLVRAVCEQPCDGTSQCDQPNGRTMKEINLVELDSFVRPKADNYAANIWGAAI